MLKVNLDSVEQIPIQANGVRTVQFIGDLAPRDSFSLEMQNSSGKLILAGGLANQQAFSTFFNTAIVIHGAENVIS